MIFRWLRMLTSSMRNNTWHDLTLVKLIVVRWVGTESLLDILTAVRNNRIAS